MRARANSNLTWRRAAALGVDLVAPGVVSGAAYGLLWLWWRPDRAEGMASLGVTLTMVLVAMILWLVAFVANEIVLPAARDATLGERICDLELELPQKRRSRRLRLAVRATLRLGLVVVVLSVFGLATEHVGEHAGGVAIGALVSIGIVIAVCRVGAQGPTSVIDRVSRIGVVLRPQ